MSSIAAGPASHDPLGTESPPGRRKWLGLVVLVVALSMVVMDGTIVGVSLPVIIDELDLDLTDAQWVNSLYSVVFAALLLTTGRLGDRLGRRKMLVLGVVVFMVGSVMASASGSATALIVARVVQGVGGAFVLPATLSSVNATFRGKDRAAAFGVWGAVISGVAAIGPLLGGWLTDSFSWPWIFLVNIPIGILVLIGAFVFVPESTETIRARGLDVDGLLLSAASFGLIVFAIVEGSQLGWWRPLADLTVLGVTWPATAPISPVPVLGALGVILLVTFVVWERHRARNGRSALLDLSLFSRATFSWGNLTAMLVAVGEFGLIFLLPLFLVNALGLSVLGAGLVLAGMAFGAFLSGAAARHVAARLGSPGTVVLGLALEVVGVIAVALVLDRSVAAWFVTLLLAVYGVGLGLASAQLTSTVLADIPVGESGQGSATQSTVRQVGSALGPAVVGAVLSLSLASTVPAALGASAQADQLADATRTSAGGVINGLRDAGAGSPLGGGTPDVVAALSEAFASATSSAMLVAAGFLLVGLVASIRVMVVARRQPVEQDG